MELFTANLAGPALLRCCCCRCYYYYHFPGQMTEDYGSRKTVGPWATICSNRRNPRYPRRNFSRSLRPTWTPPIGCYHRNPLLPPSASGTCRLDTSYASSAMALCTHGGKDVYRGAAVSPLRPQNPPCRPCTQRNNHGAGAPLRFSPPATPPRRSWKPAGFRNDSDHSPPGAE